MTHDEALAAILARTVEDLPGRWSIGDSLSLDLWTSDLQAIVVRLDLPAVGKAYAQWVALPTSALTDDVDPALVHLLGEQLHDGFRPWLRSDRNPMPSLVLWPRMAACEALWRRLRRWWTHEARPKIATW